MIWRRVPRVFGVQAFCFTGGYPTVKKMPFNSNWKMDGPR